MLPVGGIKEKVLAARRVGIRRVILPRDNEKDLAELPENVRQEMEFIFASRIEDAFAAALTAPAKARSTNHRPAVSRRTAVRVRRPR